MTTYHQKKMIGGLLVITNKNSIKIIPNSFEEFPLLPQPPQSPPQSQPQSPLLNLNRTPLRVSIAETSLAPINFDRLKYINYVKSHGIYLFTNSENIMFILFINDKRIYYRIIQRNVNQFQVFDNEKYLYVMGINHSLTFYSFEKIMDKFMDYSLELEMDDITSLDEPQGSPTKNLIKMADQELYIFSKSISAIYNDLQYYDNFVVILSQTTNNPELLEITILNMTSLKTYLFRIEKNRSNIMYNNQIFAFHSTAPFRHSVAKGANPQNVDQGGSGSGSGSGSGGMSGSGDGSGDGGMSQSTIQSDCGPIYIVTYNDFPIPNYTSATLNIHE